MATDWTDFHGVVEHFSILGDSAMWIEPESNNAVTIPTMQLRTFTFNDRVTGGVWGMMTGILVGGIVGGMIVEDDSYGRGVLLGAALGELAGLGVGTLVGVNTHYIIEP